MTAQYLTKKQLRQWFEDNISGERVYASDIVKKLEFDNIKYSSIYYSENMLALGYCRRMVKIGGKMTVVYDKE